MDRPPITFHVLTIIGLALSAWLVLFGLELRFFGSFIYLKGLLSFLPPPHRYVHWLNQIINSVDVSELGWPLVVIGCSLAGSIAGLWKRQGWALPSLTFFAIASIITLHGFNILSFLIIVLTRSQRIQEWVSANNALQR
jgi:hypothetical protein